MAEPKRYEIDKLTDLLELTPEQLEDCLQDIKSWYGVMHNLKSLAAAVDPNATVDMGRFVWIDDGKHDVKVTLIKQE